MNLDLIVWQPGEPLPPSFLYLPHILYQDDPYWIPERKEDLISAFDIQRNPYFRSGSAQVWVIPNKARLAGFFDPELRIGGEPVAYFGYWECVAEPVYSQALFTAFEQWAAAQGAACVYGPINFNTFNRYRIRLNLQEGEGCFPGEPYNPPFYKSLLEAAGYIIESNYISQYIPEEEVEAVYAQKQELMKQIDNLPFTFQYLTGDYWLERLPDFYKAVDIIFGNNFAYKSISWQQFQVLYGPSFAVKLCPRLSVVVLNEKNDIIAFSLGFPDYAPLCNQSSEHPIPYAEVTYQQHFPLLHSPTFLLRTIGVMPGYRRQDLMNAMGVYAMAHFRQYYSRAMACLMKADNFSTYFFRDVQHIRREYGLFTKRL